MLQNATDAKRVLAPVFDRYYTTLPPTGVFVNRAKFCVGVRPFSR